MFKWANPFLQKFYSPNILSVASSLVGEDSLSHHVDPAIGVYIIDRYTLALLVFGDIDKYSDRHMPQIQVYIMKNALMSFIDWYILFYALKIFTEDNYTQIHLLCPGVPGEGYTKLKEDDGRIPESLPEKSLHIHCGHKDRPLQVVILPFKLTQVIIITE